MSERLRALVDATALTTGTTGVARYARELLAELPHHGVDTSAFALGRGAVAAPSEIRRYRAPLRMFHAAWRTIGRPTAENLGGPADLFHSLDLVPAPSKLPLVMTVHDLDAIAHPSLHPPRAVQLQRLQLAACKKAAVICADSEATATALARHGVERVIVAPLGVTPLPVADDAVVEGPFLLAVGDGHPRKGHEVLVRAFAAASLGDVRLVFAGPAGAAGAAAPDLARVLGVEARCDWVGRMPEAQLGRLYRDAIALCLPSYAEGFGLPVLEALAVGCPVVASDLPVIREIAGGMAILVPPGDVDALAEGIESVVKDKEVAARARREGPAWSQRYSWTETASMTRKAYEMALASGPPRR